MLSAEQQKIVSSEDSLKLVNSILKKLGIRNDEDLRQDAMYYLCKCISRFDPEQGTKWTTYAYKNVMMYVKSTKKRQMQKQIHSIDFTSFADNTADLVISRQQPKVSLTFLNQCNAEERNILRLRYLGYKVHEIGAMYGCSRQYVSQRLKEIREKLLKNS